MTQYYELVMQISGGYVPPLGHSPDRLQDYYWWQRQNKFEIFKVPLEIVGEKDNLYHLKFKNSKHKKL